MTGTKRHYIQVQIDRCVRSMLASEHVEFCSKCGEAFDVVGDDRRRTRCDRCAGRSRRHHHVRTKTLIGV